MKRYLSGKLDQWRQQLDRKPLILNGARQVGKSFLVETWGLASFPKIHVLNFEKDAGLKTLFETDLKPRRIVDAISVYLKTDVNLETDLLFFDEIQTAPKALTSLKYFNEDLPNLAVISAGSLLGLHLSDEGFPVGKVELLNVFPMSFFEFLEAMNEKKLLEKLNGEWSLCGAVPVPDLFHEKIWEIFRYYLIVGGLPACVKLFSNNYSKVSLFSLFQEVRVVQENLVNTYVSDMAKHSGKIRAMHLERLWKNIPKQLAQSQDESSGKFQFRDVLPGYNKYSQLVNVIDWLERAGLIYRLPIVSHAEIPLQAYAQENTFKLYLFDVGVLGALSDLSPESIWEYGFGTYKGFFAENFVLQELKASGTQKVFSWCEKNAEIEFLITQENRILPIEVKSGKVTRAKSMEVYRQRYKPQKALILNGQMPQINSQKTSGELLKGSLYQACKIKNLK